MDERNANESTLATLSKPEDAPSLSRVLVDCYKGAAPVGMYVLNGIGRRLEFDTGMVINLEKRAPAIVVLVLNDLQAAELPAGQTDISVLLEGERHGTDSALTH